MFAAASSRTRDFGGHPFHQERPGGAILSLAMAERRIRKVYLALAEGTAIPDTLTIDAPIGPVPYRRLTTINAYSPAAGRRSATSG